VAAAEEKKKDEETEGNDETESVGLPGVDGIGLDRGELDGCDSVLILDNDSCNALRTVFALMLRTAASMVV
jgi:hypothetical protein